MIVGITGGTGFIGHAVQEAAKERGDSVVLFSRSGGTGTGRRKFSYTEPLDVSECEGLVTGVARVARRGASLMRD